MNGSKASAASRFCQNAMSVAVRDAVQRRFITTSSANVKPDTSPQPRPCTIGFDERKLGHQQDQPARDEQRRHPFAPAQATREEHALGRQREQRKARVAEETDGHRRDLNRREEGEPVHGQHDAVGDQTHVERGALVCAQAQDAQGHGRNGRASEDDGHGRQGEPLAEESREAEQRHGDVQRDQRGGVRHPRILAKDPCYFIVPSRRGSTQN